MKLKKILLSPWLLLIIIVMFAISQMLEQEGLLQPIVSNLNIVDIIYFVVGAIAMYFALRKKPQTIN